MGRPSSNSLSQRCSVFRGFISLSMTTVQCGEPPFMHGGPRNQNQNRVCRSTSDTFLKIPLPLDQSKLKSVQETKEAPSQDTENHRLQVYS